MRDLVHGRTSLFMVILAVLLVSALALTALLVYGDGGQQVFSGACVMAPTLFGSLAA